MRRSVFVYLLLVIMVSTASAECSHNCITVEEETYIEPATFDVGVAGANGAVLIDDAVAAKQEGGGGLLGFGTTTTVKTIDGKTIKVERGLFGRIWSVKVK